jgi:hypothetical protein
MTAQSWRIYSTVTETAVVAGRASRSVDEDFVTELITLERRIAADEYTIALARAAGGNRANKVTIEEDLKRRTAETASRMDKLRGQLDPPGASHLRHVTTLPSD